MITRRRIIDHFRRRTDPNLHHSPVCNDTSSADELTRIPDPASSQLDTVWEAEWQRNLLETAIERVNQQISPNQFQIFDLSILRALPMADVTALLKVNTAQVYLARHRVSALIKKEVRRLETLADSIVISK